MTRTTPPRPVHVEKLFPELGALRGVTTRLHPRPGRPDASVSSVVLCCGRPANRGRSAPSRTSTAAATASRTGGTCPASRPARTAATCSRLWCPFEAHGPSRHGSAPHVRRRHSDRVAVPPDTPPQLLLVGFEGAVAEPCVLHPEQGSSPTRMPARCRPGCGEGSTPGRKRRNARRKSAAWTSRSPTTTTCRFPGAAAWAGSPPGTRPAPTRSTAEPAPHPWSCC